MACGSAGVFYRLCRTIFNKTLPASHQNEEKNATKS
jgi:hypothetical protein